MKKRLLKSFIAAAISSVMIITLVGCFNNGDDKMSEYKGYKKVALEKLEEKYNEEFDIKQDGGTFGATNNNKKLICYPKSNENTWFEVQVTKDLSKVYDDYAARKLEAVVDKELESYTKEIFGDDLVIKSQVTIGYIDGKTIDFSTFDFNEYMSDEKPRILLNIYINRENGNNDAHNMYNYIEGIHKYGIKDNFVISVYFIKEKYYENVDKDYYQVLGTDDAYKYFKQDEVSYSYAICKLQNGNCDFSIEELEIDLAK